MKYYFLLLALLVSLLLNAQKNTVGFFASPDYAYRVKENNNTFFYYRDAPKLGYTAGVTYERNIHKNFAFTTGLSFSNKGYRTKKATLSYTTYEQLVEKNGYAIPRDAGPYYTNHVNRETFFLLSIPIGATFYINAKGLSFFINAGITTNYTLSVQNVYYATASNKEKYKITFQDKDFFDVFSFSAAASIGVEKQIVGYKFRVFPNVNYCINNFYNNYYEYKIYPYSIGVGLGMYKSF